MNASLLRAGRLKLLQESLLVHTAPELRDVLPLDVEEEVYARTSTWRPVAWTPRNCPPWLAAISQRRAARSSATITSSTVNCSSGERGVNATSGAPL